MFVKFICLIVSVQSNFASALSSAVSSTSNSSSVQSASSTTSKTTLTSQQALANAQAGIVSALQTLSKDDSDGVAENEKWKENPNYLPMTQRLAKGSALTTSRDDRIAYLTQLKKQGYDIDNVYDEIYYSEDAAAAYMAEQDAQAIQDEINANLAAELLKTNPLFAGSSLSFLPADQLTLLLGESLSSWGGGENGVDLGDIMDLNDELLLSTSNTNITTRNNDVIAASCGMEGGVKYLGTEIEKKEREDVNGVEKCRSICASMSNCEAWTFRLQDKKNRCNILTKAKAEISSTAGYKLDDEYVSGPAKCGGSLLGPAALNATSRVNVKGNELGCPKTCPVCATLKDNSGVAMVEVVKLDDACCPACVLRSQCESVLSIGKKCAIVAGSIWSSVVSQITDKVTQQVQNATGGYIMDFGNGNIMMSPVAYDENGMTTTTPLPYSQTYIDTQDTAKRNTLTQETSVEKTQSMIAKALGESQVGASAEEAAKAAADAALDLIMQQNASNGAVNTWSSTDTSSVNLRGSNPSTSLLSGLADFISQQNKN